MFAPIITPIDSVKVNKPAFAKLTIITVVADDDCKRAVMKETAKNTNKSITSHGA